MSAINRDRAPLIMSALGSLVQRQSCTHPIWRSPVTHPKHIDSLHRSQEYLPDNAVVGGREQALAKYTISLQENVWVCSVRQALGADLSFAFVILVPACLDLS